MVKVQLPAVHPVSQAPPVTVPVVTVKVAVRPPMLTVLILAVDQPPELVTRTWMVWPGLISCGSVDHAPPAIDSSAPLSAVAKMPVS
ncbi:hypothetical protein CCR97_23410 [Rhodoplanes elegans]|uniref:Uncharacterized protein n=1 Tax=Rhodoplanes elegans TaxID=29408 RepID=A0A327KJ83_9BRAD|nr:hypothetical protein [Rhodoplanes elegans]RAI38154.1 hypothetical protein CH338_13630 [Rhodoplanes elegans]